MDLFAEILISAAVCLAIFLPLNAVRNKLRFSFSPSPDVSVELTVRAYGEAESLEHVVGASLRELSKAPFISRIVIVDEGLSEEARTVAELVCAENENVYISEDPKWTELKENLV